MLICDYRCLKSHKKQNKRNLEKYVSCEKRIWDETSVVYGPVCIDRLTIMVNTSATRR